MLARINKFSTAISDEGLKQGWTSISQLKDVQPSDRYYQAAKSLATYPAKIVGTQVLVKI